jgi:hypothetical protein
MVHPYAQDNGAQLDPGKVYVLCQRDPDDDGGGDDLEALVELFKKNLETMKKGDGYKYLAVEPLFLLNLLPLPPVPRHHLPVLLDLLRCPNHHPQ